MTQERDGRARPKTPPKIESSPHAIARQEAQAEGAQLNPADLYALQGMVGNTAVGQLGQVQRAPQNSNGQHVENASQAAFQNIVQRTPSNGAGKPQITPAPVGHIQRHLINSAQLQAPNKAGPAKEDKKFFGKTVKKMSGKYKAVLTALDNYHQYNPGAIKSIKSRNMPQVKQLKALLQEVKKACNEYTAEHRDDETDPRTKHINDVYMQAELYWQIADMIHEQHFKQYVGQEWLDVMHEMSRSGIELIPDNPTFEDIKDIFSHVIRVKQLTQQGAFNATQFHGTGGGLLDKITDGHLYTGAKLEEMGKIRSTGEGDFFSRPQEGDEKIGEKPFISTGEGLPGMGTALTYANAAGMDKNYNAARYTDELLDQEITKLEQILGNWDENLNQVPVDDIMGAKKTKGQFEGLYKRLKWEQEMRENLLPDHPRRRGETYDGSTYGLMFEFASDGLDVRNPRVDPKTQKGVTLQDDTEAPRALGGERSVWDESINLRDPGRLLRVYCPLANMNEVRMKVTNIVQHNQFEVIPFEALVDMPNAMQHTLQLTTETLEIQYEKMRQMVLEAYATGMGGGSAVDKDALAQAGHRMKL